MTKRKENPQRGGPKPTPIDLGQMRGLARIQCTLDEIAAVFDLTPRAVQLRIAADPALKAAYEQGKATGRVSLRRLQWRHAEGTGPAAVQMTIHLSKHILGETDRAALEVSARIEGEIEVRSNARERIDRKLATLSERIARRVAGLAETTGAGVPAETPVE
jgi:hypothetical protein